MVKMYEINNKLFYDQPRAIRERDSLNQSRQNGASRYRQSPANESKKEYEVKEIKTLLIPWVYEDALRNLNDLTNVIVDKNRILGALARHVDENGNRYWIIQMITGTYILLQNLYHQESNGYVTQAVIEHPTLYKLFEELEGISKEIKIVFKELLKSENYIKEIDGANEANEANEDAQDLF